MRNYEVGPSQNAIFNSVLLTHTNRKSFITFGSISVYQKTSEISYDYDDRLKMCE